MKVDRTYKSVPASIEGSQKTEELAAAFLRSLNLAKQSASMVEEATGDQELSSLTTTTNYLLVNPSDGGKRLRAHEETWGNKLAEQELRNKTLKKTWLIDRIGADLRAESQMTVVSSTAVTDEFKLRVHNFLKRIPAGFKEVVLTNRMEILVVGNVGEVDPELAFEPARRHPQCEVVGNLPVYYEARLNALIFSEKPHLLADKTERNGRFDAARMFFKRFGPRFRRQQQGKCYPPPLARCAAHEFGRAVDKAISNFSAGKEFDEAFQNDLAKMSEAEKSKLWYFTATCLAFGKTQPGYDAAKEELFAELFALHQGLERVSPEIAQMLIKKFPSVNELLKARLESLLPVGHVSNVK
jgi:hypothetical protein